MHDIGTLCDATVQKCHSEYPIARRAIRASKEPQAHLPQLGVCFVDCGAQPRFWPGAAGRHAFPVPCLNGPASWSAERELRFGGESAALAAHSKPSFTSTACGREPNSFVHEQAAGRRISC